MIRNVVWNGRSRPKARLFQQMPRPMREPHAGPTGRRSRAGVRARPAARPGPRRTTRTRLRDEADPARGQRRAARGRSSGHALGPRDTCRSEQHGQHDQRGQPRQRAAAFRYAEQRAPASARPGVGQHVEVEAEQQQHGDEVQQALEDDRREAGRRADRMAARDQVRAARTSPARGTSRPVMKPTKVAEKRSRERHAAPAAASRYPQRQARSEVGRRSSASDHAGQVDGVGALGRPAPARSSPRPGRRGEQDEAEQRRPEGASRRARHRSESRANAFLTHGLDERDGLYYTARASTVKPGRRADC